MNRNELVREVAKEIILRGSQIYRDLYENPKVLAPEIELFRAMDAEQKAVFFKVLRDVQVDTLASFFSFLDGEYLVDGQTQDLVLCFENEPGRKLNGELADLLLEVAGSFTDQTRT